MNRAGATGRAPAGIISMNRRMQLPAAAPCMENSFRSIREIRRGTAGDLPVAPTDVAGLPWKAAGDLLLLPWSSLTRRILPKIRSVNCVLKSEQSWGFTCKQITYQRGCRPAGCGGERASAALPLLNDITISPASRRLASARPALAPECELIFARILSMAAAGACLEETEFLLRSPHNGLNIGTVAADQVDFTR